MAACSKPSCSRPGSVVLAYDYGTRIAVLEDPPHGELSPHLYLLCGRCADRLGAPLGWDIEDRRQAPPLFLPHAKAVANEPDGSSDRVEDGPVTRRLFFGESA